MTAGARGRRQKGVRANDDDAHHSQGGQSGKKRPRSKKLSEAETRALEDLPTPPTFKRALPQKYLDLLVVHQALFTACALHLRRGLTPAMSRMKPMVETSMGGREFTTRQLRQLVTIDPVTIRLRLVPRTKMDDMTVKTAAGSDEDDKEDEEYDEDEELELAVSIGKSEAEHYAAKRRSLSMSSLHTELSMLSRRFQVLLQLYIQQNFAEFGAWLMSSDDDSRTDSTHGQKHVRRWAPAAPDIPQAPLPVDPRHNAKSDGNRQLGALADSASHTRSSIAVSQSRTLRQLTREDFYVDQFAHVRLLPERQAKYAPLAFALDERVVAGCAALGVDVRANTGFYKHQADAINAAVLHDRDVVVATDTASGKSMCYHVPVAVTLAEDDESTALYLYPTKALARDQLQAMRRFFAAENLLSRVDDQVDVYDGDVPIGAPRARIRRNGRLVLTNPDTLQASILPQHHQWKRFLQGLRHVIIDEAHAYRGVFGIGCALVLRRLFSLCASVYNTKPRAVLCTATIGNAKQHSRRLLGRDEVHVVRGDAAPRRAKLFAVWNPPLKHADSDHAGDGVTGGGPPGRRSSLAEASKILARLAMSERRTIAFARVRKQAELLTKLTHQQLQAGGANALVERVRSYRGGYLAADRRRIEQQLRDGELLAVVATSALELGIDIGALEVSLHLGFPGSIASLRQQAGRAGRGPASVVAEGNEQQVASASERRQKRHTEAALALMVLHNSPLDQHYASHPEDLFEVESECVAIDVQNRTLLRRHVACAVSEGSTPHTAAVAVAFGAAGLETLEELECAGDVLREAKKEEEAAKGVEVPFLLRASPSLADDEERLRFSLRNISVDANVQVVVESTGEVLEAVEPQRAIFYVFPGAVYLFSGRTFIVASLEIKKSLAKVRPTDDLLPYYTSVSDHSRVHIERVLQQREVRAPSRSNSDGDCAVLTVKFGEVRVVTTVYAYRKINVLTGELLEVVDLDLPNMEIETKAFWFDMPPGSSYGITDEDEYAGGLHVMEHLLHSLSSLFVLADPSDVRGWSTPQHFHTQCPQVFLYETTPSGVGIAEELYTNHLERCLSAACDRMYTCPCVFQGCPSCVHLATCYDYNNNLNKVSAMTMLRPWKERASEPESDAGDGKPTAPS